MKFLLKNTKGITLIALIVTIIVLLILAGITIGELTSDDGIVNNAKYSAYATKIRKYEESVNKYLIQEDENDNSTDTIYITDPEKIKEIIADIEDGDENKFVIQDNELKYKPDNVTDQEEEWLIKLEIAAERLGYYLLDNETYYNTLAEAVSAAKDGSTIQVIADVKEKETDITGTLAVEIDKNITINTNNKELNFNQLIRINQEKNVVIEGGGEITGKNALGLITNYGNLTLNDVILQSSSSSGKLRATITNIIPGNVTINNCEIDGITCEGTEGNGIVTINGGKYGKLAGYPSGEIGKYIINDAEIEEIDFSAGGIAVINSGVVNTVRISNDSGDIHLTIGDINKAVSTNNPKINNIECSSDLAGMECVFDFYNGFLNFANMEEFAEETIFEYNLRPGYKLQESSGGLILVEE